MTGPHLLRTAAATQQCGTRLAAHNQRSPTVEECRADRRLVAPRCRATYCGILAVPQILTA